MLTLMNIPNHTNTHLTYCLVYIWNVLLNVPTLLCVYLICVDPYYTQNQLSLHTHTHIFLHWSLPEIKYQYIYKYIEGDFDQSYQI